MPKQLKPQVVETDILVGHVPDNFKLITQDQEFNELMALFGFTQKVRKNELFPRLKDEYYKFGYALASLKTVNEGDYEEQPYFKVYLGVGNVPYNLNYVYEVVNIS